MSISALGRGVPGCTRCAQHLRTFSSHSVSRESAQKPAYRPRQAKHRPPPRGPSHRDRPTTDRRHAPSSKPTIRFSYEAGNLTQERRAFDAAGAGAESSAATQSSVLSSPADVEDVDGAEEGLTAGRVVEVRRSGSAGLGLILGSILVNGRSRLLLLRPSGEIWPATAQDVQFLFPIDTIPLGIAARCWSPSLLASWANGEEPTAAETPDMVAARRQAVRVMRQITIDTENKINLLSGGAVREGTVGGAEAVWHALAREKESTNVTANQAVGIILQHQAGDMAPSSALAYAAHRLLMTRADLFLAEAADMWNDGRFLVRSREEVERTERVGRIVAAATPQDKETMSRFCDKVRRAMAMYAQPNRTRLPEAGATPTTLDIEPWTDVERDMLHVLSLNLYETRSTQSPPSKQLSITIAKTVLVSPPEKIDSKAVIDILYAVGAIAPWDSTRASMAIESVTRATALSGATARGPNELLKGTELDDLREDFTGHKVFVIDDPNAEELDDGVSIQRVHDSDDVCIHVHIADPTRYLHPNHPAAVQASHMGSSLYLPEGGIPLFDLNIIMRDLSLGAEINDDIGAQGVLTLSARISPDGEMRDSNVRMGWVKKPRVVTYASVDEALQATYAAPLKPFGCPAVDTPDMSSRKVTRVRPDDIDDLKLLRDTASAVKRRRLREAGLEWANPQASIRLLSPVPTPTSSIFTMSGLPTQAVLHGPVPETDYTVLPGLNPSQAMIAEFMILAGRVGARFCDEHSIPAMYRGSARPLVASGPGNAGMTIEQLLARRSPTGTTAQRDIVRAGLYWEAGSLSPRPAQHWIMGFDDTNGYLRLTSPLRRYEDCIVHWQIKEHLAREKGLSVPWSRMNTEEVESISRRAETGTRRIKRLGKDAEEWWQAGIIARHLGSPAADGQVDLGNLEAMTIMSTSLTKGAQTYTAVMIPALGVKAQMRTDKGLSLGPGEDVRVRITESTQWPNSLIKCEQVK